MTPEVAAHLARASQHLDEARLVAALPLAHAAARSAYFAAFHAAEALIFPRNGKVAKTHAGVHAEFARLTRDLPPADGEMRRILGRGYTFKDLADYAVGLERTVSDAGAAATIADAARFIDRVAALLSAPPAVG